MWAHDVRKLGRPRSRGALQFVLDGRSGFNGIGLIPASAISLRQAHDFLRSRLSSSMATPATWSMGDVSCDSARATLQISGQ
eukprot:5789495-Pyramimonas_sp.AAC.1